MTRAIPRTSFHSSQLARCLADLSMAEPADAGNAFAEKVGQWIHFTDAITLSAVHNDGMPGGSAMQAGERAAAHAGAVAELERIQDLLAYSITQSCSPKPGRSHIKLPVPDFELPLNLATAYPPYRRFYEAHQRDMDASIQPLRFNVRATVAKASPRLRKLAELDAALEKTLRDRENKMLAKVPALLRKRFDRLFKEHQHTIADAGQADDPARWMQAGGWLARFCNDMQMLLLAELDLRLQPTMGLIEALKQDTQ